MTQETATLYDEIRALLDEPSGAEEDGFLDRAEHTLTDGYARALTLETERVRLEKRMGELAGGLNDGSGEAPTEELGTVARRLSDTEGELARLRGVLRSLRARARSVSAPS
jgi:ABC-type phosphate transport system auxiliary subunit